MTDPSFPTIGAAALFTATLMRKQRAVYGFVRGLIGNAEQAHDITQDVFLVAWRAVRDGTPPFHGSEDERGVRRWLYCVAYRRAVSALRHQGIVSFERLNIADDAQLARLGTEKSFEESIAEQESLRAALADLGTDDAACLLLYVVQGFTTREIAAMLEITLDAAKKRVARAKQRLRDAYFAREQSPAAKEVRR
jgi:RNA polymerase sigma-70 factor (ECF subfamily)